MIIIYKYPLTGPRTTLNLPIGSRVLTIQLQGNTPMLWACINQDEQRTQRRVFLAINTGVSFDGSHLGYISTIQTNNGLVWHFFEDLSA